MGLKEKKFCPINDSGYQLLCSGSEHSW